MLGTTVGTLLSSSLVAYPLARMDFVGKNVIFTIIIATMMIPNIALIIPQYIMHPAASVNRSRFVQFPGNSAEKLAEKKNIIGGNKFLVGGIKTTGLKG